MVRAWEPEWAEFSSDLMREELYPRDDDSDIPVGKPRVGWFAYLRADRLHSLPNESPCDQVIQISDIGSMFVLTRDHRVSGRQPDDVAALRALIDALEGAGALAPMAASWDD